MVIVGFIVITSPISTQSNLFHSELFSQLDVKDSLIQLANTINWTVFDDAFEQHYSQDNGICLWLLLVLLL
jgi:hypothetical protein